MSHIHGDKVKIIEGEIRTQELKEHINKTNSKMAVFLSEDASGIVGKVTYDPKTNQLVGIVLPLKANGMPKTMHFRPNSSNDIEEFMKLEKSYLVYIIVAHPLGSNAPPFILSIFGTNNKFTKDDVLKRWQFVQNELQRNDISVIGIASDGDTRLLASMRQRMKFWLEQVTEEELEKFGTAYTDEIVFIQDTIHIGTKLRNRLLKAGILMPMGSKLVSISHLKTLLVTIPKSVHLLVRTDICPQDRQNYNSLEKIMSDHVIEALEKNVIGSEATVMYLRICKFITSSFLDVEMTPIDRIYNVWHALYFLRAWRKWLKSCNNEYRLDDNFITSNAYLCIEINAHSIIYAILKLRNGQNSELFQTKLFSSQPCENMFRLFRSMGTPNYTKINFSLYELLHMVSRVELMNNIAYSHRESGTISFPQFAVQSENLPSNQMELPSNVEILGAIKKAQKDALENARLFGMEFEPDDVAKCEHPRTDGSYDSNAGINVNPDDYEDDFGLNDNDLQGVFQRIPKILKIVNLLVIQFQIQFYRMFKIEFRIPMLFILKTKTVLFRRFGSLR